MSEKKKLLKFNIRGLLKAIIAACIGYVTWIAFTNGKKMDELEDEIDDLAGRNTRDATAKLRLKRLLKRKERYDQLFCTLRSLTDSLDTGENV